VRAPERTIEDGSLVLQALCEAIILARQRFHIQARPETADDKNCKHDPEDSHPASFHTATVPQGAQAHHVRIHRVSTFTSRFAYYLGSLVYGANDGIITTFAVVSGAAGAGFSSTVIIVLGIANLFADGFSMGASKYLSLKSEQDAAGADPGVRSRSAAHDGLATFAAFVVAGALPLFPFIFPGAAAHAFVVSSVATAAALFLVGSARALVIPKHAALAGFEMLVVGGVAAALAFLFGSWVQTLIV